MLRRWPVQNTNKSDHQFLLRASRQTHRLYIKRLHCLHYSAALCCLMRLHEVEANLVIGVKQRTFGAHSWVEMKDMILISSEDVSPYEVIERI